MPERSRPEEGPIPLEKSLVPRKTGKKARRVERNIRKAAFFRDQQARITAAQRRADEAHARAEEARARAETAEAQAAQVAPLQERIIALERGREEALRRGHDAPENTIEIARLQGQVEAMLHAGGGGGGFGRGGGQNIAYPPGAYGGGGGYGGAGMENIMNEAREAGASPHDLERLSGTSDLNERLRIINTLRLPEADRNKLTAIAMGSEVKEAEKKPPLEGFAEGAANYARGMTMLFSPGMFMNLLWIVILVLMIYIVWMIIIAI